MPQVLIVSNRLPMSIKKVNGKLKFYPSIGGLATGLSSYVKGRKSTWVGWPGLASEELNDAEKQIIITRLKRHNCYPVFLSRQQIDEYYNGYSNSILWPIFHSMPASQMSNEARLWKAYQNVNKLFLETIQPLVQTDSVIWVHDYQLLLLPELLRSRRLGGHIGFFLHIPFPNFKTFAKAGHTHALLSGMLGADLVGFHTSSYSENFIQACHESNLGIAGQKQIILEARNIHVTHFPIGIDYEKYAQAGKLKSVKTAGKKYRKKYGKRKIIVAVDRLEPSKGLTERLKAYRDFLEANPKFRSKVTMVMVAAPSRMDIPAYQRLQARLIKLSKEINDEYGTSNWLPVDFINESLPFEEVSALYQLADIAFIAPLRDGMNLVAKEFVASKHNSGILILSQTAGASEELRDALIVNPKKPSTVVDALQKAMNMPKSELRSRLKSMQQQISTNTIHTWASTFVKTLQQPVSVSGHSRTRSLQGAHLEALLETYHTHKKRLILLDYDGTLMPFTEHYSDTLPSKHLLKVVKKLVSNKSNDVVVVSGRQASDLDEWFKGIKINLIGEHGAVIKKAGARQWKHIENKTNWRQEFLPVLEKYTARTPHAMIEIKPNSLVWHYRGAPAYAAQKNSVIIKRLLKPLLKKHSVELFQGNKILEIKDPKINKGTAVQPWLTYGYECIIAIGDDYTDEDLFELLQNTAYTIKVGQGRTRAGYRLKSVSAVIDFLEQLNER